MHFPDFVDNKNNKRAEEDEEEEEAKRLATPAFQWKRQQQLHEEQHQQQQQQQQQQAAGMQAHTSQRNLLLIHVLTSWHLAAASPSERKTSRQNSNMLPGVEQGCTKGGAANAAHLPLHRNCVNVPATNVGA